MYRITVLQTPVFVIIIKIGIPNNSFTNTCVCKTVIRYTYFDNDLWSKSSIRLKNFNFRILVFDFVRRPLKSFFIYYISDHFFKLPKRTIIHEICAFRSLGWAFCLTTLCIKKIKAMLVLLLTRRFSVRSRWRGGLTHTVWMPGIAGSTPVARRGFSVMKPVSCVTCRSNLKARRIFHVEIMEGAHILWVKSKF